MIGVVFGTLFIIHIKKIIAERPVRLDLRECRGFVKMKSIVEYK